MNASTLRMALIASFGLTTLSACDDASVKVCVGDVVFCSGAFDPTARAGADQTVAVGDLVTLDGSNSESNGGSIKSYSWSQTGGTAVTLTDANKARATFMAPVAAADTR